MPTLVEAVRAAAERSEVRRTIAAIYEELQVAIEARRPVCVVSGRCCRFEEYGHRLYVTTMELAAFVHELNEGGAMASWDGRGCPFQEGRLCGVHARRPFGCRVFFCDVTAATWQEEQYQRFHDQLRRMHKELGVPYYYVEWREGLRAVLGENVF